MFSFTCVGRGQDLDPDTQSRAPATPSLVFSGSLQFLVSLIPHGQDPHTLKSYPRLPLLRGAFPRPSPVPGVRASCHDVPTEFCSGFSGRNVLTARAVALEHWVVIIFFPFCVSEVGEHIYALHLSRPSSQYGARCTADLTKMFWMDGRGKGGKKTGRKEEKA